MAANCKEGPPATTSLPEPKELSALYSKQLYFLDGSPLIPVRLMEGREVVTVASTGPIRIASGGATVMGAAGSSWTIRRTASEPAIVRTSVQLAELPFADSAGLAAERELWERRGLNVRTHTIGALYGVRGKVIDRRPRLLLLEPAATASEAEQQQDSIFKTHPRQTLLFTGLP